MLVLFETPAGYALYKLENAGKLKSADDVYKQFDTASHAKKKYPQQLFYVQFVLNNVFLVPPCMHFPSSVTLLKPWMQLLLSWRAP
jgi:hypothetical protein